MQLRRPRRVRHASRPASPTPSATMTAPAPAPSPAVQAQQVQVAEPEVEEITAEDEIVEEVFTDSTLAKTADVDAHILSDAPVAPAPEPLERRPPLAPADQAAAVSP